MTRDEFWEIIDSVHDDSEGNMERKCRLFRERLRSLTAEDLTEFIGHFYRVDDAAYTWELWGAAFVIHGGCGDDSFGDFRATVISHGRGVYEAALRTPESLADLEVTDAEDLFYEGFQHVIHEVADATLGGSPTRPGSCVLSGKPGGMEWDESTVAQRYPKLNAKYGG